MNLKRLLLAGTHSGVGKTTLTAGLITALCRRGLAVQPFKVGPDYIDPSYHSLAAGRPCRNLDTWLAPPSAVATAFLRASKSCDVVVIEGVMGLYDGFGYDDERGSTAEVAKLLACPVILVIDAAKVARSAAALATGFCQFDRNVDLAGFIVNRVGSERHGRGVASAIDEATGKPVFGWIPRDARLELPERHLGLVPTAERGAWQEFLNSAADTLSRYVDIDRLLATAEKAPSLENPRPLTSATMAVGASSQPRPVIAVARDEAFQFTYPENIELLEEAGAEIAWFSPLADDQLPGNTAAIVLSGGFPELYAARLADNRSLACAIREAHQAGMPMYAECGGLMYLTESIIDPQGNEHEMLGLIPGRSRMTDKLTLGYRTAKAANDSWLFDAGQSVRGHEFHYSTWEGRPSDLPPAYVIAAREPNAPATPEGACVGNLWASYVHIHFAACPDLAERLVAAARIFRAGCFDRSDQIHRIPAGGQP